ncbi:MAG: M18 family aminopeptidase [Myxococcales bacterium]|nr:M18 family aminopeptidase [Myxococcales bacterium]
MTPESHPTTLDLLDFIHQGPTPEHCVAEVRRRLEAGGFAGLREGERWALTPGQGYFVARHGTILAFRVGREPAAAAGLRMLGAHTDSPNLRIKPLADVRTQGYCQLGVEAYGGLLEYTWLDRDLGLAGRVMLRAEAGAGPIESRLVRIDRPILRIPSLAIHLQRELRETGLKLNRQLHLAPILGIDAEPGVDDPVGALRRLLAGVMDVDPARILTWDLSLMDTARPALGGRQGELVCSPRLDNQAMCHAALSALLRAAPGAATQMICLYDHEEVGSGSATGADSSMVEEVLRRLAEHEGPGAEAGALPRAVARSAKISADMAHAVHPNFADKHEPRHLPLLNRGPVIKVNAQQRYATTAETAALFEALCQDEGVPYQKFVNRTDLACGSTIGPLSAARLGVRTVDVGNPMLAMHSIRETAGAEDPERMVAVMRRFLELEAVPESP